MVSNFIMMNLISQVLKRGFLLSMEQIFNKLFGVDIEDIFVFLVLLEQLLRSHDIFIKHGLNLLISFNNPRKFFSNREVRLLLLLQEGH
jgi:hypothetical protein